MASESVESERVTAHLRVPEPGEPLQFDDIQGLAFFGYGHLKAARYVFLRVEMGGQLLARAWLRTLVDQVTTAKLKQQEGIIPDSALNLAFSAQGLEALGVGPSALNTFLQEFREGMAHPRRSRILGDTGESAPDSWQFGSPRAPVHFMLILFAPTQRALEALHAAHRQGYAEGAGVREVFIQDTRLRAENKEPFGFRDGISFPYIAGVPTSRPRAALGPATPAGEFILGYRNAYGQQAFTPRVGRDEDPEDLLPGVPGESAYKDLGRNGSYLVVRKLRQDVRGFRAFLEEHGPSGAPEDAPRRREWLAAKLVGRWQSGAPLMLRPDHDDRALGKDDERNNDFGFAGDPRGLRCPFSSHIRRANPRDALEGVSPEESRALVGTHLLVRRSRPYRERLRDAGAVERGILFVALNADLARQFEFIQQTWLNNPKFHSLHDTRDPIVGNNHDAQQAQDPLLGRNNPEDYSAVIPAEPFRIRMTGLPRFVHTRGGEYFFLPGIRSLRYLTAMTTH
ncbi:MAG: Dyp-type peroxidase [Myxococcaceae bacterium]